MATRQVFQVAKTPATASAVKFVVKEAAIPALGVNDLLIKVLACGVCHTDFYYLKEGNVPGHEIVGRVEAVGSESSPVRVGQLVGAGWLRSSCVECKTCLMGREQLCTKRESFGSTVGGYSSHVVWDRRFVTPIPDGVSPLHVGPLMCAGATVYSALANNNVKPGSTVGVIGVGGLGHLAVQFAKHFGCRVIALSRSADKRDEIMGLGATDLVVTNGATAAEDMKRYENSIDFLLNTVPAKIDWEPYFKMMAPCSTVCMVGVSGAPLELPSGPFIMKEMRFAGSLVAGRQGLHDMLQFAALHKIEPMIEPIPFSPEGIEKAIQRVDNNTVRYRAVLYHPDCPGAPGAK